ncbi:MAG: MBOAT family protein [Clostridiales bacterium]|nr:MBOAT family protein [Clostridiales bacterium]
MLFSSIPFLYYFLPCVLILYFVVPKCLKNTVLLLSSLVFYAWGEPKYVLLMAVSITLGYVFGLLIEIWRGTKLSKLFLILSIVTSLGLLGYFKYADFFIANFNAATGLSVPLLKIALPIGISFYTFQILSYTVDVYRGEVKAQRNYISLAVYVALFPQLIAGPIVRYSDIAAQLESRTHSFSNVALGTRRFILGLAKKVLIANALGELCDIFKESNDKSVLFFWLYAIAFTLHIYFDFSGYSDMAIGLGKIFGFDFLENFDYPYISGSITEFWRRWHMSLGSWFRDYVYIPLGGNRVSKARWFLNIFIVWMLTGFWHGAAWNFIVWGLFFAILLIIEKLWLLKPLKKSKVLSHIYVMFFVIISFVIFNAADMKEAFSYIGGMFGAGGIPFISEEWLYYLRSYGVVLIVAIIGATPLVKKLVLSVKKKSTGEKIMNIAEPIMLVALLLVITAYLVDGSFNPFLYFRF